MNTQVKPVDNTKMLTLIALLSNYDLFHVSVSDGREFGATRITDAYGCFLHFERQFAKGLYTDEKILDIRANSETEFVCSCTNSIYTITALHKKPEYIKPHTSRTYKEIEDLMDTSFFSERLSYRDSDGVVLVVDPYCLGELNIRTCDQIKKIINLKLNGLAQDRQVCRTIYFQVMTNCSLHNIYVGIFNLEQNTPLTRSLLFNNNLREHFSDESYNKFTNLLYYSETHYKDT